jgi:hypothetical protein
MMGDKKEDIEDEGAVEAREFIAEHLICDVGGDLRPAQSVRLDNTQQLPEEPASVVSTSR